VVEIMDAVHADVIKGMYIMGENPAMSDPDLNRARQALAHLEHLVVQDLFLTETAVYADVVLPASAWPEKDGTVTNTNRQVQMGRQALPLPGDTRHDWWLIQEIGRRIGLPWNYRGPDEIYTEMASLMPSLNNISWERVQREGAVTYPADAPDKPGRDVVFGKGFPRPGGFGKLVAAKLQPPDETPNEQYPFILTTGRQLEHWHTGAMTRRATTLDALEPSAVASVSRGTLAKLGKAGRSDPGLDAPRRGRIGVAPGRRHPRRGRLHPVCLCRGGRQYSHQSGARSIRQDSGIQILRRARRGGRSGRQGGGGGVAVVAVTTCAAGGTL
jgi:formate dehydrogenase major subunit